MVQEGWKRAVVVMAVRLRAKFAVAFIGLRYAWRMPIEASHDEATPITPCIGVCRMDADGLCIGCRRTLAEIARWGTMSQDDRRHWVREVQSLRPPSRP